MSIEFNRGIGGRGITNFERLLQKNSIEYINVIEGDIPFIRYNNQLMGILYFKNKILPGILKQKEITKPE